MTAPKAILKDQIVGTNLAQLQAVGSNEGLQVGTFGYAEDSGIVYRCASVDGANSSTWATATPHAYFDPAAIPTSPHALDLEFNSAADVSGMTSWNPGSLADFAASAVNSNLLLRTTPQVAGTVRIAGLHTAAPASSAWSAWTKVSFSAYPGGAVGWPCGAGLLVVDNDINPLNNPTTCDFYGARVNLQRDAADGAVVVANHSNYTNQGSNLFNVAVDRVTNEMWLRVRYNSSGTVLSFDVSKDGVGWKQVYTTSSPTPSPTRVGLFIVSAAGAADPIPAARFDFLRFSESANVFDATNGRVV